MDVESSEISRLHVEAGVGFLINRKWKDHIVRVNSISPRVPQLVLCIIKRYKLNIVQVYKPTKPYSEEYINSIYNTVDEKPNHYTIVIGYFNAQIGGKTQWKRQRANLGSNW